jgi:hypothetical protein
MSLFTDIHDIKKQIYLLIKQKMKLESPDSNEWSLKKINELESITKDLIDLCEDIDTK